MLGKLLKYDFKATNRFFLPMYAVIAILTIFNKLFIELVPFDNDIPILIGIKIAFLIIYILSLVSVFILTFVILVIHFYKRMTGDEGYLTFTLPVKVTALINSKILISSFWTVISTLVVSISLLILGAGHGVIDGIGDFFQKVAFSFDQFDDPFNTTIFFILIILLIIIGLFSGYLMMYTCIAIGHLFGKHRILGAIGSYISIHIILQVFSVFIMSFSGFFKINSYSYAHDFLVQFNSYMLYNLIYYVILSIIYYLLTVFVFGKKLNLE